MNKYVDRNFFENSRSFSLVLLSKKISGETLPTVPPTASPTGPAINPPLNEKNRILIFEKVLIFAQNQYLPIKQIAPQIAAPFPLCFNVTRIL